MSYQIKLKLFVYIGKCARFHQGKELFYVSRRSSTVLIIIDGDLCLEKRDSNH